MRPPSVTGTHTCRDNGPVAGHVEVGVLGPVEVRVDGAVTPLPSIPQRVVLARLALSRGHAVPVTARVVWTNRVVDLRTGC